MTDIWIPTQSGIIIWIQKWQKVGKIKYKEENKGASI